MSFVTSTAAASVSRWAAHPSYQCSSAFRCSACGMVAMGEAVLFHLSGAGTLRFCDENCAGSYAARLTESESAAPADGAPPRV